MGRISRGVEEALRRQAAGDQSVDAAALPFLPGNAQALSELRGAIGLIEAAGVAFKAKNYPAVENSMREAAMLLQAVETRLAG